MHLKPVPPHPPDLRIVDGNNKKPCSGCPCGKSCTTGKPQGNPDLDPDPTNPGGQAA